MSIDLSLYGIEKHLRDTEGKKLSETLFKGKDFRFKSGMLYCLTGKPKSGKTMFLRLLLRLNDPDRGSITLNGEPIVKIPLYEYRHIFSATFKRAYFFTEEIQDEIGYFANFNDNIPLSDRKSRISTLLSVVSFPHEKRHRNPNNLSEEEKGKIQIARTIFGNADIILLDEALDKLNKNDAGNILAYLKTLSRQENKLIILSSTEKHIQAACDQIVDLSK